MTKSKRLYIGKIEDVIKSPCLGEDILNKIILDGFLINNPKITSQYKRGDIVITSKKPYRNDDCYVFNGCGVDTLEFDDKIDEYGYLPDGYDCISEFTPDHWEKSIHHNNYVRIDLEPYRDEIIKQLQDCQKYIGTKYYNYIRVKLCIPVVGRTQMYKFNYFKLYIIFSFGRRNKIDPDKIINMFENYMKEQKKSNIKCNIVSRNLYQYEDYCTDMSDNDDDDGLDDCIGLLIE